jgi:PKD domain
MKSKALRIATASLFIAVLAACGGGGGSAAPTVTPISTTLTMTGTAATGLAIPGAIVTGKCKVGTGIATTLNDGTYTLTITDGNLPCVLQTTNPVDGIKLHTVVTGGGNSVTANITPLTEMATARVLGSEPNVFFAAFDGAVATQKITSTAVQIAQADVSIVLTGTVDTAALGNFMSAPFKAATQSSPNSGDAQDKLLDALKLKLSSAQIGTLTTAFANNQTTDAIKQIVVRMTTAPTVPPTANAGAAQSVVKGTTVTLDASSSSAGAGKSLTYAWTLTTKPAGSTASLAAPTTVKPTFVADMAGSYVASVIVNDGTTASSASAVTVNASVANAAPVASAGLAQNVVVGSVVTLDGSASSDANSDPLTYAWTLTSTPAGSTATLSSATSAKPTFTANVAGAYVASLTVNDGKVSSTAGTVSITAAIANVAPVANAGIAQNVVLGANVTLDGSASSDANGDSLTYAWTLTSKPSGSATILIGTTSAMPIFITDVAGTYVATLVVNDGKLNSTAKTVAVTAAAANVAPVANAGVAQNVVAGSVVTLDASASSDANGDPLTYAWTLTAKPIGSTAALSLSTSAKPSFMADVVGAYVASLSVNDGKVGSNTATISITAAVANVAPVANAGTAQSASLGDLITLDGSASSDANGDVLTYAWSTQSFPSVFAPTINGANTARPSFSARDAGTYVFSLVVNDGRVSSTASTSTVTVANGVGPTPAGSGLVVENVFNFWTLDETTMTKRVDFSCGVGLTAIDRRPDGVTVGTDLSQIYEVNPVSGACKTLGKTPEQIKAVAVSAAGQMFGMSLSQVPRNDGSGGVAHRLHKLTSSGASQSYVFLSGATSYVTAIDFGPDGQLYGLGITLGGNSWSIVRINPETGVTTVAFAMPVVPMIGDIDIDSSGVLRTMIDGNLYKININTGALISSTTVPNFPLGASFAPIIYVP